MILIRLLLIGLILILLLGCTSQKPLTTPPELQLRPSEKLTLQASLPQKPSPISITAVDGKRYAAFDVKGLDQLTDYVEQSKQNTAGLNLLVAAHNQSVEQNNLLIGIAKQQEARANTNYALYVEEFNAHERDKTWWSVEKIFWQALAIIGLAL